MSMEDIVGEVSARVIISEIAARPALHTQDSVSKKIKQQAWIEVAKSVIPNFEELSQEQKVDADKIIQRRWKSFRDQFKSSLRSGVPYIYGDLLQFLLPPDCAMRAPKRRRREQPEEDDVPVEQDPQKMFMLSMVKELKKVPEERHLDAQIAVATLLRSFQRPGTGSSGVAGAAPLQSQHEHPYVGGRNSGQIPPIHIHVTVPVTNVSIQYGSNSAVAASLNSATTTTKTTQTDTTQSSATQPSTYISEEELKEKIEELRDFLKLFFSRTT